MSLDHKVAEVAALLARIESEYSPAVFASSFGAEDMVLTHLIASRRANIRIVTLDTGRLPKETLELMQRSRRELDFRLATYVPIAEIVDDFVARNGQNPFYDSVDMRKRCCYIRKVEPLNRALVGARAWLTGMRREQAASRGALEVEERDADRGIAKFNPLADWSSDEVWAYLRQHDVPYNALHDRGYPSIGCEPCTRAVQPGEDPRAGRWWWERDAEGKKECGLHISVVSTAGLRHKEEFSEEVSA
ncbi:MAG: phosphoadenylyl-sulfate reductase [Betaproteobacteria bacterium]|nr:phosphoadenylyl-sulfate reductase [Betaproteobacteria bacterium]